MFDFLFEWIQNLAFYLVIITAVVQILPGKSYKKYIQFFSGLVMILLMLTPILKLAGTEAKFYELYHSREYEMEKAEIERSENYLKDVDFLDFLPEEYQAEKSGEKDAVQNKVEVEEIRFGQ
ncbi:stage III sporulation protein AF [Faecalicatena sp. AGMB00832]|uniref:Stage III sporulation protein AF n=1 Tax=Faecalicatena faecalis TaxID=2726362 RepID=A0ABS6D2B7_9FIRM|nr:stage III sporulation protein AF [Faecalicatena faecalis]MBU3875747.1 stage III sporulation protein AF [Faecalicatena faecalis]